MRLSPILPAALLLAACVARSPGPIAAVPSPEAAARFRSESVKVLFWTQAERDHNFRQMEKLFPSHVVRAGGKVRPLAAAAPLEARRAAAAGVDAMMASLNIAGLIVLQDGKVRLERYARGFGPGQRWTSFSVAKSLTSILVGAAVKDGFIRSIEDPVTRYIPELAGSAYEGVTVRQVLAMTSGVRWNEDYSDPKSDVARMFAVVPPPGQDATVAYLRTLPREAAPGTKWVYKTGETNLVGVLVRRATGKPLAAYLAEKLWRPYGMEADAYWQVDENGQEAGGCCLSATLRDYARVGQFMLEGGHAGGKAVLPEWWISQATSKQADIGAFSRGYGFQWWTGPEGTYDAIGIFGQMIHIDPQRRLVIAVSSAWPRAVGQDLSQARAAMVLKLTAAATAN